MVTDMVADMEVYNKLDQIELDLGPRHEYVHHVYEWERLRGLGGGRWERLRVLGGEEKVALKNCCGNGTTEIRGSLRGPRGPKK